MEDYNKFSDDNLTKKNKTFASLLDFQLSYLPQTDSPYLIFFQENSKILEKLNLENWTSESSPYDLKDAAQHGINICTLPNNQLFCLIATINDNSEIAFIIEDSKAITYLKNDHQYFHTGCIYYQDSVYTFSNNNQNFQKFNLRKEEWECLAQLPGRLNAGNALMFGGQILYAGHSEYAGIYDPIANSHIVALKTSFARNYAFIGDNKAYVISNHLGRGVWLYESKVKNPYDWEITENLCLSAGHYGIIRSKTIYNGSWYFILENKVYQFNLKAKDLRLIKKLDYF